MSIRLRLTLIYTAILAITLIVFGVSLYAMQTRVTYDTIQASLIGQANGFANALACGGGFRGQSPNAGEPGAPPPPREPNLPSGALPGRWSQTRSADGLIVIARTFDLSGATLPLSSQGLAVVQSGVGWFETAQVQDEPLLIYSRPAMSQVSGLLILQVAAPIAERQQSLANLRLLLIAGSALSIALAFAAGWVVAGTVLRPIHRLTQTAQAIGAEHNFSRRVAHVGPADEIGQLATTFNAMLAELEIAYRQLEESLDSQRRFVADASHELRTPLTTVRGNIELLRREPPMDADERAEVMADTTDEVNRLIRLVNQLLVLARADAGQKLRLEPLEIKPLVEDVCRQAQVLSPRSKVICDAEPDACALGDRDALKQVLLILLDNALVHTAPGTAIGIKAAPAGDCVAISVRDTGPGIPPDVLPHIFERFYRGAVSRSGTGTGLGLAIAMELAEAQDGMIEVASEMGKGSVFTVRLPLVPAP